MIDDPIPEQEPEPVDLTPLAGLRLDPARSEALLARIEAATAPGLARRAAARVEVRPRPTIEREVERVLARFSWPALAAAAIAALLVLQSGTTTSSDTNAATTLVSVAQTLTQTDSATRWIADQSTPTDADLVWAIGLETGQ